MKFPVIIAAAVVMALPLLCHAESNPNLTRPQVRAQLAQLETAGYNPAIDGNYPSNLQHAEAVLERRCSDNAAYGIATAGTAQSGK
ncbi:DUF4148 domain-containing protein [Caballeronia sordidicola]|uniref:DUF4148 domain-containing protein n=1 Tax=Caballeronia sordidicola TaxID=196367 RepID=UPI000A3B8287|nr:DUF4148 domain-containing protein [Caballeronia sordidicola]